MRRVEADDVLTNLVRGVSYYGGTMFVAVVIVFLFSYVEAKSLHFFGPHEKQHRLSNHFRRRTCLRKYFFSGLINLKGMCE